MKTDPPSELYERESRLERRFCEYLTQRGMVLESTYGGVKFVRGFVDGWGFEVPPELLAAGVADAWASLGPMAVNGISFAGDQNGGMLSQGCAELVSSPGLKYWTHYRSGVERSIGEANCVALFGRGRFANLRRLTITDQARGWDSEPLVFIGDRGLKAIAENAFLTKLIHLKLWWAGFGDDGLKALANTKHLRGLRKLSLADEFTDDGIAALSDSPILETVEHLHLNGHLTGRALEHIMSSRRLKSLHTLDLSVWTSGPHEHDNLTRFDWSLVFDERSVNAFVNSPLLPQLKVLKLSNCGITPEESQKLAQAAPRLTSLERLSTITVGCRLDWLEGACRALRGVELEIKEEYGDPEDA